MFGESGVNMVRNFAIIVLLSSAALVYADSSVVSEFIRGADISIQTRQETDGVIYNEYGVPKDIMTIFMNHDLNWIRIRIFNNPSGSEYGVCQDINYVTALGARVKADGFKFLLDFHFSDTWADPSHQTKPAAWSSLTQAQLVTAIHDFTRDVISHLRDNNAMPDMVQIGNETNCGLLWPNGNCCGATGGSWANLVQLINSARTGIDDGRGSQPMPLIMIHTAYIKSGGGISSTQWFYDNLISYGAQFDIIGQSYYPEWHGTLDDLTTNLTFLAGRYSKNIVIAEAGDYYTGSTGKTPATQRAYLDGLIQRVQAVPSGKGLGIFYWEPTWVWNSSVSYRALFQPISGNWRNMNMLTGLEAFDKIYGDMNGDGIVDLKDLPAFFSLWLANDCNATAGLDLDSDCVITFYEFSALAQNWHQRE